ncbi:hypothetical protein KP509_04G112000 [Ceratopteris richardii]|uniref:Uncharacterized protein n=1 Tax=Ceratopteris richardii TaxID=49495 RepID=A0A8T2UWJ5_CERRI|nr:hypothetical protein KP509_04G112000 [Ceratopteris richardii]
MPWHRAMNVVLQDLHSRGVSIASIRQAVWSLPLPSETISALKAAHFLGFQICIISDANTFFIEEAIAHHGLGSIVTQIHSNPAWIDAMGCLHYDDLHGQVLPPHDCPLCPPNMCKGSILENIRAAEWNSEMLHVIYAGDGSGDLCPALRLSEGDYVLPRKEYPLSKLVVEHDVKAKVYSWINLHDAVLECLRSHGYDCLCDWIHGPFSSKNPSDGKSTHKGSASAYDTFCLINSCPTTKFSFCSQQKTGHAASLCCTAPTHLKIHIGNKRFAHHRRQSWFYRTTNQLSSVHRHKFRVGHSCPLSFCSAGAI